MAGWIKIYRDLQDHWLAQDMGKLGRWISLLLMATHETKKVIVGNQIIELKRGQIIASNSFLAKKWGTSERSVLRFLELLEKDSMLHRCTHRKVTILTISNYDSYQEKSKGRCTDSCTDSAPIAHRCRTETKNEEECKEYNIDLTNARTSRTREERVEWDDTRESGFVERFKAQGSAILIKRTTGKSPEDVMRLLDVYLASRQIKNLGHKDFNHFLEAFQHAIKNNKISVPVAPVQPKEKKVISGAAILDIYG